MGSEKLLRTLQTFADKDNLYPMIFIFDHDENAIVSQVSGQGQIYKDWGNNVYSFAIPIPPQRNGFAGVSIEMYFSDDELLRSTSDDKRFFFTSEFTERTGRHIHDVSINYTKIGHF